MDNEVMDLIEALYSMVSEAWGVPLGNDKCIVERDKVLNMLEDIKAQLPVELSEAKRLVSARDVVRIARARSSELMATAENRTAELRRLANDYVDDILRRTEETLSTALGEIRSSHSQFRSAAGVPEAQPAAAQRNNSQ